MKRANKWIAEILLVALALIFLSPIYIMLVNSFKDRAELYNNALALPSSFSFKYYGQALEKMNFLTAFGNSLYVTLVSVIIVVVLASMTAWMLVRTDNKLSKIIFMVFVATMLIPFQTLMMPLMQTMGWIRTNLGIPMLNTHEGLIFMNIGFMQALLFSCITALSNRCRLRWKKRLRSTAAASLACSGASCSRCSRRLRLQLPFSM
jgi:raffinose/stachyose/melibiose transport system permease protein